VRDRIDREYAEPLDAAAMARTALMSPSHFARRFRVVYTETPHAYLMTRRIERAMVLLRAGSSVNDACLGVGCASLGSFSGHFAELVGVSLGVPQARPRGRRGAPLVRAIGCHPAGAETGA
jgi:AraC-like DNA-binding protein